MSSRQQLHIGVHLASPVTAYVMPARPDGRAAGIAVIDIIDGLRLQSDQADAFRRLAALATEAADSIDAAAQPIGGAHCPCSGAVEFFTDDDREMWNDMHAGCAVADDVTAEQVSA